MFPTSTIALIHLQFGCMVKNHVGDIQLINLPIAAKNGTKSLRDCW